MGRRRSSSGEGLLELAASLPWWLGVALAGVSFVIMSRLASGYSVAAGAVSPVQVMIGAAAGVGRVALPIIFLVGAAMSLLGRRRRAALFEDASGDDGAASIRAMSWRDFELLVGEAFRRRGYRVVEAGQGGADGGIDLVLQKDSATELVQCKHWKAFTVGVKVVRELYGVMADRGAVAGWVVTSGRFTSEASEFARGKRLHLVDGPALADLLTSAREGLPVAPQLIPEPNSAAPPCPLCQKSMVRRVAGKGARAGLQFWGCAGFPSCRGTRAID